MQSFIGLLSGYWNAPEVLANLVVLVNIFAAMLIGLIVGYERSYRGRAAGMRTYGFVCMASCALTAITGYPEAWFGSHVTVTGTDPSRVIQGIVTGIGFLGAGVIMRDGLNISGLMTAASIWAVAVIGVLIGVGFYVAAVAVTIMSTILMIWGARIEMWLPSRHAISISIYFRVEALPTEADIKTMADTLGYEIATNSYTVAKRDGKQEWKFVAVSKGKGKSCAIVDVGHYLAADPSIESYHILYTRN
jgi:putative Mg2+ transporter-C (MgtC) family protein